MERQLRDEIRGLERDFAGEIHSTTSAGDLEKLRIKYLSRKGVVQVWMRTLSDYPLEERRELGKWLNDFKKMVVVKLDERLHAFTQRALTLRLNEERVDVTLPGRRRFLGRAHPISQMIDEVVDISIGMGFSVSLSPEIETEYYNYAGLNYPLDHPARDMQDTLYIDSSTLLRSHTTSVQQRIMRDHSPPIRIVSPGKCYRNETITSRSHVLFHQVDALYIDKGVTFASLLHHQEEFYTALFQREVTMRVRPSYFPFVEPGVEVDIRCTNCDSKGCSLCKGAGWLEVSGAGMVHPAVLEEGGIDPELYSGYAWGLGIERLLMLRHGVDDIRLFTENDLRFLSQFP